MSSYDLPADEIITPAQFQASMKLVRLQIAVPISVLMSMGTNLVCALALKPGLRGIMDLYPTLVTPNVPMVGLYWGVTFILMVGFCLNLLLARKDITKETLVHGVGLRFAIANWLQAGWAVCFTLQFFIGAEILLILNAINLISIQATLLPYPASLRHPVDALFIHAPIIMLSVILFELDWLHSGFIALNWVIKDESKWYKWTWQAVGAVGGVNLVMAIWEGVRGNYLMAFASEYILLTLIFSSPRTNPTLPTTALPKPTGLIVMLIICLVLHPVAILAGVAWQRTREKEGRIRLQEEVEEAEAEADAEYARHGEGARVHAHAARTSRA